MFFQEFSGTRVQLECRAKTSTCTLLIAEIPLAEAGMEPAARVFGHGFVPEPLAAGPIFKPFDAAPAIREVIGAELLQLAGIGRAALVLEPVGSGCDQSQAAQGGGNGLGNFLVAANCGMDVIYVPIVAWDAVGTLRS